MTDDNIASQETSLQKPIENIMNDNVITNDDNDDNDNDTIVSAGSNNNNNNHTKNNEQDDKTIIAKNNNENDDSKSSTKIASDATITTSSASNTTTATTNISTNIQSSSTNIKTEANLESWNNTSSSSSSQPQPPQSQSQYPFGQAAKGFNDRSLDPALFAADPSMKLAPTATTNTTAPATVPVTSAATSNNAPPTTSAPTPIATSNAPIGYYNQAPIFDGRNGASFILTTTTQPTPQDYPSTTYSGRFTNGIAVIPPPNFSISPNNNNKQSPSPSPRQVTSPQSMMTTFSSKTVSSTPKRYKCSVCQKRFTRPSSLQTHMYSHTGEKPFKCPVEGCGRHFSVVSNLRRHQKIHTNNNNNSSSSSNMAPSSTS